MLESLLLVIGFYAAAALLVHLAFRFGGTGKRARKHYVLIAVGSQPHMEWYLRSMHFLSSWSGSEIRLTVLDHGLSEEAKAVMDQWNRGSQAVEVLRSDGGELLWTNGGYSSSGDGAVRLMWALRSEGIVTDRDYPILIDLQNTEDLSKMPF